jgi:hypothetical protein
MKVIIIMVQECVVAEICCMMILPCVFVHLSTI